MERKTKHFACVCVAHQNTKFMVSGVKPEDLTSDISLEIDGHVNSQSLTTMIYSPSTEECFFSGCVAHAIRIFYGRSSTKVNFPPP
jgi:hypothetical protein